MKGLSSAMIKCMHKVKHGYMMKRLPMMKHRHTLKHRHMMKRLPMMKHRRRWSAMMKGLTCPRNDEAPPLSIMMKGHAWPLMMKHRYTTKHRHMMKRLPILKHRLHLPAACRSTFITHGLRHFRFLIDMTWQKAFWSLVNLGWREMLWLVQLNILLCCDWSKKVRCLSVYCVVRLKPEELTFWWMSN